MQKLISNSEQKTKEIAAKLAKESKGRIFALNGELGAGKTTFAQGFAKGLKIKEKIISPTFVLIRQHQIPNTAKILYHIDLYRLKDIADPKNIGLEEILENPNNIVLIEWAERYPFLPKNTIKITINKLTENKRQIILEKSLT